MQRSIVLAKVSIQLNPTPITCGKVYWCWTELHCAGGAVENSVRWLVNINSTANF
jgi:hypothetical protein